MATLTGTSFTDTAYLRLPLGTTAQRWSPTNAQLTSTGVGVSSSGVGAGTGAMRINSQTGGLEFFDGTSWSNAAIAFPYRQIINTHFVNGGYKDAVTWLNVNKCYAATDTTVSLGDVSERSFNYAWGACSKTYNYVFGAGNGHAIASNYTTAFNMKTEIYATDISRTLAGTRHTFGGVHHEDRFAFISGGDNARIEEYNMYTKTLVGTITPTFASGSIWGMSTENYGIFYGNGCSTFTFASRTIATRSGNEPGAHHQQKAVMSKFTYGYAGNQGSYNGGYNFRRTNFVTNTSSATDDAPKNCSNSGEENYTIGQDWQYTLGVYDGNGQTNNSGKFTYATETVVNGSASMNTKGVTGTTTINGRSSGVGGWCD